MVRVRSSDKLPFLFSSNTMLSHQFGHLVFATNHPLIFEFIVYAGATICTSALLMDDFNLMH